MARSKILVNPLISTQADSTKTIIQTNFETPFMEDFSEFVDNEIVPSISELEKLSAGNRIHLQKLIFTNLVDRFDYAVDKTLLDFIHHASIRDSILKDRKEPVTEQKLFEFLLKTPVEIHSSLTDSLKDDLRKVVLRKRISVKLSKLCVILAPNENLQKPRVNEATGDILAKRKTHKNIPVSIQGYCDWLYCRRNAVVHGGGTMKISDDDFDHLKIHYKVSPSKTVKLLQGSIKNASNFYKSLIAIFKDGAGST